MKKKVVIGVTAAVVIIILVALLVFVFSGKNTENTAPIELNGIWKVTTNVVEGKVNIPQNEYMIFADGEASDFRDGNKEPCAKSSYSISGEVLELPDISRTYHIAKHTDQHVSLYTNDSTFMTLVQADSEDVLSEAFSSDLVTGKWNVTYRPTDKPIENEYLVFEDGNLADYRDNAEKPAIEAEYEWNGNIIKAPALGIEMMASFVGSNRIVLIDINEGYVWLLTKAVEN